MKGLVGMKLCLDCDEVYFVYYEDGETDDKECPRCTEIFIEFTPEDLTEDYEM